MKRILLLLIDYLTWQLERRERSLSGSERVYGHNLLGKIRDLINLE